MNKMNSINFYGGVFNGLKILGIMFQFYFLIFFLLLAKSHGELLRSKKPKNNALFFLNGLQNLPLQASLTSKFNGFFFVFSFLTKGQQGFHTADYFLLGCTQVGAYNIFIGHVTPKPLPVVFASVV